MSSPRRKAYCIRLSHTDERRDSPCANARHRLFLSQVPSICIRKIRASGADHKPLEITIKKRVSVEPPKLQRMLLQRQRYQVNVQYVPGKEVLMADALSRAHLPTTHDGRRHDQRHDRHDLYTCQQLTMQCRKARTATNIDSTRPIPSRPQLYHSNWMAIKHISCARDRPILLDNT